jgi:hypothetical protein
MESEIGEGLAYSINQEKYLRAFLDNGDIPIDNSASERAIRPFCVGRKTGTLSIPLQVHRQVQSQKASLKLQRRMILSRINTLSIF